ncbi:MAG TPA: glycoside hydrolase family 15 protein [Steroidobacteraceae bacterium]|nr:glycoside hydrolase family 15 protein [Steroidobacteraceae bacterium]
MAEQSGQNLDLGVIGNCEVSALVDRSASIVWMCLPKPDGDPVFSALLQPDLGRASRGVFAIDMIDLARTEQRYLRNTAILETVLHDARGGSIRVTDFCPRFRARGRTFRPMTLVRLIERVAGRPLFSVRLKPTSHYGAHDAVVTSGSHHLSFAGVDLRYRVTTDASISALLEDRPVMIEESLSFVLGPDETVEETPAGLVRHFLEETRQYWQDWVRTLAVPVDYQLEVIRAAITLKLCTYEDTGAVMAALTTSIPESRGSGRTWDYRYCWLRDAYFVIQALNRLGATRTMEGYLHYIDHIVARSSSRDLQPLYRLTGDTQVAERCLDSLPGYLGMGPVRVGNQAAEQIQYDVYGSVILAATQLFFDERLVRPGEHALFQQLERLGERAAAVYELPDAGPWEFRGTEHVHTFSAAMSWAACDRLALIASRLSLPERARHWRERADAMRERILTRAWSAKVNAFSAAFDGEQLDAALLLLPELGLLPATDPRFKATLAAIGSELRSGDLLFRYRHSDDFGRPEAAFLVCGFWYVNALVAAGQCEEAREHFAQLLRRRNHLGLLSEDVDPATGELWGNFPQTYSMVGVISCALRISRHWEEVL